MKKTLLMTVGIVVGSIIIGSIAAFGVAGARTERAIGEMSTLFANGTGVVQVKADIFRTDLTILTTEKLAREAQQKNDTKANAVIEALKKIGVMEKDLKTTGYALYPVYKWNKDTNENELVGYQASYTLNVTVYGLKKMGEVIDVGTNEGVNQIGGISYDVKNHEEYNTEALKLAMRDAKKKAEIALGEYGKTIFTIKSINLGSVAPVTPADERAPGKSLGGGASGVAPNIMNGAITFTVYVSVEFGF
jgi:hypothetical protein